MNSIFETIFEQYSGYETLDIVLEQIAVVFTLLSVWFSKKNNVLVFPTGLICTSIYVYLLLKFSLIGDTLINAYYFVMSVYGWYIWTRKVDATRVTPISRATARERRMMLFIFIATLIFVGAIYLAFDKWNDWTAPVDTITTAIFFVGMWLMAKRKIENWIFWIIGDIITVPLYTYKGLAFSSILYFVLTIIAIFGYLEWKKHLDKNPVPA